MHKFIEAQEKSVSLETPQQTSERIDFLSSIYKIGDIIEQAGGINDLFFEFAAPHIDFLESHLHTTKTESALYAALLNLYTGRNISIDQLSKHLHCKVLEILHYMNELENLEQKRLIRINRESDGRLGRQEVSFELRFAVLDAIRRGRYEDFTFTKNLSIEKFFVQLEQIFGERERNQQTYINTIKIIRSLLEDNGHLAFVKKVQELSLCDDYLFTLLLFYHYTVNLDTPEFTFRQLGAVYGNNLGFTTTKTLLRNGTHSFFAKGLIENVFSGGFGDTEKFRLTDFAKEEFLAELDEIVPAVPVKELKQASAITPKNLFYPAKTQRAIDELTSILQTGNFKDVQERLSQNGMRTGFACLFSGGPGTGKTETAHQIARITGRAIMQVNIAETKSKWFGESEKQIKATFDKYRACVKKCKVTPILLFNEADAVLGKRQLLGETRSGPGQTENAIQNIILQEIENLNGILIATTNLSANLDAAFERRFLYKIDFEKPNIETRTMIWRSLIDGILDETARELALRFDFSGGQIENVARKSTVHRVLCGSEPAMEVLTRLCADECLHDENINRIGFAA